MCKEAIQNGAVFIRQVGRVVNWGEKTAQVLVSTLPKNNKYLENTTKLLF